MKILIAILALYTTSTFAHVEPGVYQGKTESGATCEMTAIKTFFEGALKHPLTERVELVVNSITFNVQHPAIIDETKPSASFDHDQFKGVAPNSTGADALVMKMTHTKNYEGPMEYYLIKHNYKTNIASVEKCANLVKK